MSFGFDLENKENGYLDEKELFILYSLYKDGVVSSYTGIFVPNPKRFHFPPNIKTPEEMDKYINEEIERNSRIRTTPRTHSHIIYTYLLDLGNKIDENNFHINCNVDYSLVEGGFLVNYLSDEMYSYLGQTKDEKAKNENLNKEQKVFLDKVINGKIDLDHLEARVEFSKLATVYIPEYQKAIIEGDADEDFIDLVNKLIKEYDGGHWDKDDLKKFIEIYFRHNKERGLVIDLKDGIFGRDDAQTALAQLIFGHMSVHLSITDKEKITDYLERYIEKYIDDLLYGNIRGGLTKHFFNSSGMTVIDERLYGYKKQKEILINHLKTEYKKYQRNDLEISSPYVEPEYIGDSVGDEVSLNSVSEEESLFRFVHTIISLEKEGYLEIKRATYGTREMFDLYDRGFVFDVVLDKDVFLGGIKKEEGTYFDSDKSRLYIKGKEIKITKLSDQYHTLNTIFKDEKETPKEWFFSEINEIIDPLAQSNDKKYYNAVYQINLKLKTKGIEDFFITTNQSVKINSEYLS